MTRSIKKQQLIVDSLAYMQELFANYPLTELSYRTPFQLLVAVMMSAQTTDKQVNKVTVDFFRVVERPEDIVALGEAWVGQMIRTIGLWKGKTTNLVKMAQMILDATPTISKGVEVHYDSVRDIRVQQRQYADADALYKEWGYRLPDTIEGMTALPGVGIKTAKVVLYILYGQKRVAVDTHVHRVMNRLGIVSTKTPEQTSALLETLIPDERKEVAHRVIIYFWRYHCTAKKPHCANCQLRTVCKRYKTHPD